MATGTRDGTGQTFDDLVIGAGMAGLTTGALLAADGRKVLMLEAHDTPGGYAHTFEMGRHRFCAQVHYIFNCGEGEPVHELLRRLSLHEDVRFLRLDPEGFDHVVVAGDRYRIPNGLEKHRDRLIARFPDFARGVRRYFDVVMALGRELDILPKPLRWRDFLTAPLRFPNVLRMHKWTLQRLFDELRLPPRLETVLAGQSGDYLLPPDQVSLLLHVALVRAYDRGAYYPEKHFQYFIGKIADYIAKKPGCQLLLGTEVDKILVERDRVVGVRTTDGKIHRAGRYVSNVDPRRTGTLIGPGVLPASYVKRLGYEYSSGTITVYIAVRGIDLRDHGFGSHNVWHYPHDDIAAIYRRQRERGDFSDPWLFMSTPTLHTRAPGLCPPGEQILEIATSADHAQFSDHRARDRRGYNLEKKRIRDRILQIIEERYVPSLSRHVSVKVTGTPATNERFCRAPQGNSYGSALTPANIGARVPYETPISNLWLVNATAGFPSIGGAVRAGMELHELMR